MCLVKTAICLKCNCTFLGPEREYWKEKNCNNHACLRLTRLGAASQLMWPEPCGPFCDSEHCGQVLAYYIICPQCIFDNRHRPIIIDNVNKNAQ